MIPDKDRLDTRLKQRLDTLNAPARDPERAAQARSAYLAQVEALVAEKSSLRSVSPTPWMRLKGWISQNLNLPIRKERFAMLTTITSLIVVFTLMFGGAGATVYAAQDSLPNDTLYPLKILAEDVRYNLVSNPQERIDLLLSYTSNRLDELAALTQSGESIPQSLAERLQTELVDMLIVATEMDDAAMVNALAEVRMNILQRDQEMLMLQTIISEPHQRLLERVRTMLQLQIHLSEAGLQDPTLFRLQLRQQMEGGPIVTETPEPGMPVHGTMTGGGMTMTPGADEHSPGYGPMASQTPGSGPMATEMPGSGPMATEMPGSGPMATEMPGSGPMATEMPGSGPMATEMPGSGPMATEMPGSGPMATEMPGGGHGGSSGRP